jgi:anti-sigma-K factor RskA
MSQTHEEQALAAAYVLGTLDPAERREFEAHLATCPICAEEIGSLSRVTDALAYSVPQRTPRPELRARVLAAVTGGSHQASSLAAGEQPSRGVAREWLPLAAALVLAAGLGAYAWQLQERVATLEVRLEDAERRAAASELATVEARRVADQAQTAMAVLAAPDLVRIDLAGQAPARQATARALWSRNRGMVFTATDLPLAPEGRVYQVWVVTANAPVSAGLLTTDASGRAAVFFNTPPDIAPPVAVAVTLEPAGGVPAPTGDRFLIGTPL